MKHISTVALLTAILYATPLTTAAYAQGGWGGNQDGRGHHGGGPQGATAMYPQSAITSVAALIDAGVVRGREITSWPSVHTDLKNAGARWVDREAVVDGNLVTSRKPEDIPAFNRAMIELFVHAPVVARR